MTLSIEATTEAAIPLTDEIITSLSLLHDAEGRVEKYFSVFANYCPYPTLKALSRVGAMLREKPDAPVMHSPVELVDDQPNDIAAVSLQRLINDSITRPTVPVGIPSFTSRGTIVRDTCSLAEEHFSDSLSMPDNWTVDKHQGDIVTENEVPILFQKRNESQRTTLALTDIAIDGLVYPAGSILSAKITDDSESSLIRDDGKVYDAYDISRVKNVGFLRLSSFALDQSKRKEWPIYNGIYGRNEHMLEATMTEIRDHVSAILADDTLVCTIEN